MNHFSYIRIFLTSLNYLSLCIGLLMNEYMSFILSLFHIRGTKFMEYLSLIFFLLFAKNVSSIRNEINNSIAFIYTQILKDFHKRNLQKLRSIILLVLLYILTNGELDNTRNFRFIKVLTSWRQYFITRSSSTERVTKKVITMRTSLLNDLYSRALDRTRTTLL